MNERQIVYLAALRLTGSAPRARQEAGITRRQVANWEKDERFSEAAAEAQEAANAAILEKAREMAMAGDSSVMTTWMRALIPTLRPVGAQVAVGVQVNAKEAEVAKMSDEQLVERANEILTDVQLRREIGALPVPDVVDVESRPVEPSADDLV